MFLEIFLFSFFVLHLIPCIHYLFWSFDIFLMCLGLYHKRLAHYQFFNNLLIPVDCILLIFPIHFLIIISFYSLSFPLFYTQLFSDFCVLIPGFAFKVYLHLIIVVAVSFICVCLSLYFFYFCFH